MGFDFQAWTPFQKTFCFATAVGAVAASVFACTVSFAMIILGPSLMLRGPAGSVEKAYWLLRRENKRVLIAQWFSVVCFALCFGVSSYVLYPNKEDTGEFFPLTFSCLSCILVFAVLLYMKKLKREFSVGKVDVLSPEKELTVPLLKNDFYGANRVSSFSMEGRSRTRLKSKKWFN